MNYNIGTIIIINTIHVFIITLSLVYVIKKLINMNYTKLL